METKQATIITGGGRGIGKAIALRMAQETALMLVGRTESTLKEACKQVQAHSGTADLFVGDISDPKTAQGCLERLHENGWKVRHLVCNAGIGKGGPTEKMDLHTFQQVMSVNVYGNLHFVQACLPEMLETRTGTICIISSIAGVKGVKRQMSYCVSKHALVGMARVLHEEYGNKGIVVDVLCPDFVDTDMTEQVISGLIEHQHLDRQEAMRRIIEHSQGHRIIPPQEIAEIVFGVCTRTISSLNGEPRIIV